MMETDQPQQSKRSKRYKEPHEILAYQEIPRYMIHFDQKEDGQPYRLGDGGFGVVFRGKYDKLGQVKVAIKRIKNSEYGLKDRDVKNLKKEAAMMYSLRHPDIVTVFGIVCDNASVNDQLFCLAMEFMENGSLEDLMEKVLIPWPVKVKMLEGVTRGLMFLSADQNDRRYAIVHGDIKAGNILIDENFRAKISDFGMSHLQTITSRSTQIFRKGTITHLAPEILDIPEDEDGGYDPKPTQRSDVWSFGITIFEICAEAKRRTGSTDPFDRVPYPAGMTDDQLRRKINRGMKPPVNDKQKEKIVGCPEFLVELIQKCTRINPKERPLFQGVHAFLDSHFEKEFRSQYSRGMAELYQKFDKAIEDEEDLSPDFDKPQPPEEQPKEVKEEEMEEEEQGEEEEEEEEEEEVNPANLSELRVPPAEWANVQASIKALEDRADKKSHQYAELLKEKERIAHDLEMLKRNQQHAETMKSFEKLHSQLIQLGERMKLQYGTVTKTTEEDYKQSPIRQNFALLMQELTPNDVRAHLYSASVLEEEHMELLRTSRTRKEAVEIILMQVDKKGPQGLAKLIYALDETRQSHIADLLRKGDQMIKLRQNTDFLMNYMRPDDVIPKLFSWGVISLNEKQRIQAHPVTADRVEKLLEYIERGGPSAVQHLIKALEDTNQKAAAEGLK